FPDEDGHFSRVEEFRPRGWIEPEEYLPLALKREPQVGEQRRVPRSRGEDDLLGCVRILFGSNRDQTPPGLPRSNPLPEVKPRALVLRQFLVDLDASFREEESRIRLVEGALRLGGCEGGEPLGHLFRAQE